MCGIAGFVSFNEDFLSAEERLEMVREMTNAQTHRGPDDEGLWQERQATLGHRRLAVIDLTASGRQPMSAEVEVGLHIVFNGEIYNFKDLRQTLEGVGYHFRTRTDTEVILRSYQHWGIECTTQLRGMFAFAIWDAPKRRLLLARDRLGKKPLYYSEHNGAISFASELQGLLKCRHIQKRIDRSAIDLYLNYGYIPSPGSVFEKVFKLSPAHRGIWEDGRPPRIERYWTIPSPSKSLLSEEIAIEQLQTKLAEAVRIRMVSDVPVGAFLSGGIDSSIIVGLMASQSTRPIKTFSIGFNDYRFNELEHARRVADKWQTDHQELIVEPDALQIIPKMIRHVGEPYADVSIIPTWYLATMTKEQVSVALTGDGGDECFAGYERYLANLLTESLYQLPGWPWVSNQIGNLIHDSFSDSDDRHPQLGRLQRFLHQSSRRMADRYPQWLSYFTREQRQELCDDSLSAVPNDYLGQLVSRYQSLHPVETAMTVDLLSYLPEDLLVKVDIATMASGLEARSPFLDHHIVEFAAELPATMRMKNGRPKYLLKKAFANLLPVENLSRAKMGFGVPVGEWFRGPLRSLLEGVLLDSSTQLFRRSVIERYVNDHLRGRRDYAFQLWNLLILQLWLGSIRE